MSEVIAALLALCAGSIAVAAIPPEIKNVVAFVFEKDGKGNIVPDGTGFFVGVKDDSKPDSLFEYFVTAKHVLQKEDPESHKKAWLPEVYLRLNRRDGKADMLTLPIVLEGRHKTVLVDEDFSVDLAVIPVSIDAKIYEMQVLPVEMITTRDDFKTIGIQEGSEVFFTGLFTPYVGTKRNYPVFRFGRVALLTDEKISVGPGDEEDLYLVESGSYGGNSGSPVYFYIGMERGNNMIALGPPIIKLAGIMKGTFLDLQPVVTVETKQTPVSQSSMGIAIVVPAYKLHDLLFDDELKKLRGH
jgi:hypothetical protein